MSVFSPTLLVVEDEPLIRLDLADTLSDLGYQILEAANADVAIRLLQAHPEIVAVVTDVDMPGSMDGQQLARVIHTRWPPCRLIIVSGHRSFSASELPPGACFLPKPVLNSRWAPILNQMGIPQPG